MEAERGQVSALQIENKRRVPDSVGYILSHFNLKHPCGAKSPDHAQGSSAVFQKAGLAPGVSTSRPRLDDSRCDGFS